MNHKAKERKTATVDADMGTSGPGRSHVGRQGRRPVSSGDEDAASEVTRSIRPTTQALLWGRAAGRCEFSDCNKPLWKSSVTQESVNIAQMAHIYSFSPAGPRGNIALPNQELNAIDNLILVCHECHKKIDAVLDGGRYQASLLQKMKSEHERRIELVTGMNPTKKSHILLYGANIGQHGAPLNFAHATSAMFPHRYPAMDDAIGLGLQNSATTERDEYFWKIEAENLQKQFVRRVSERLLDGEITHISAFSLAPQPLLILLGTLLGDITRCDVYQLHREPQTWAWPTEPMVPDFIVIEPASKRGKPALVLSLSASIDSKRITSVIGEDVSIWSITVPNPHNDMLKSRDQLIQLRPLLRQIFDQIKLLYGENEVLNIFPAAPVSVCVEVGRVRMPKADMPWQIYDQVNFLGGFVPALTIL